MVYKLLTGIGAGILYSLSSYLKKENQDFDLLKFSSTVGVGALMGLMMEIFNYPLNVANEILLDMGAIAAIENIMKIIYRKFIK